MDCRRHFGIKIIGVALTNGLSVTLHVQHLVTSNAQVLYALKIPRARGLCDKALQAVFRSIVLARLVYASPAWWGFAGTQDRQKVQGFLRRNVRVGFCSPDLSSFNELYYSSRSKYVQQGFKQRIMSCTTYSRLSIIPRTVTHLDRVHMIENLSLIHI